MNEPDYIDEGIIDEVEEEEVVGEDVVGEETEGEVIDKKPTRLSRINKTEYICTNCGFHTFSSKKVAEHGLTGHVIVAKGYTMYRPSFSTNSNRSSSSNGSGSGSGNSGSGNTTSTADNNNNNNSNNSNSSNNTSNNNSNNSNNNSNSPQQIKVTVNGREVAVVQQQQRFEKPLTSYKRWLKAKLEQIREERSRQEARRREREYEHFKAQVYEAFSTFLIRYFNMVRNASAFIGQDLNSGSCAWKPTYLYQFLDNEPLLKSPELIITQRSLMLCVVPTFPSSRYCNRVEKVHVIAVQVLDKVTDKEIEAKYRLIRNVITERLSKYEIESISHVVFALEGENTTQAIESKDIPNYTIQPAPLQAKPLYSNYIKGGRIKHLIVGSTKRTMVFIGKNVYEKVVYALSILINFYASKVAGMLHDSALTTSKIALREQMKARAFQLFNSIKYYGVMDDTYTTEERMHAIMDTILTRSTFLRLLASIVSLQSVLKEYIARLLRQQKDMIYSKIEELKALKIQQIRKKYIDLTRSTVPLSTKKLLAFMADQVRFSRLIYNEKVSARKDMRSTRYYWWEVGGEGPPL